MPDFVDFSLVSRRFKVRRRVHDAFPLGQVVDVGGVCVYEWRGNCIYRGRHYQVKAFCPFGIRPLHWLAVGAPTLVVAAVSV